MNTLIIEAKDNVTPAVTFDSTKNIFEISGWSHPEDAIAFYAPVFEWLNTYSENPAADMTFHFRFEYFNTASAKQIFRLISLLEEVAKKCKVKIHWHYDSEDSDMLASGERFSKMSTIPFEFLSR